MRGKMRRISFNRLTEAGIIPRRHQTRIFFVGNGYPAQAQAEAPLFYLDERCLVLNNQ
jgi:hypothetical protein